MNVERFAQCRALCIGGIAVVVLLTQLGCRDTRREEAHITGMPTVYVDSAAGGRIREFGTSFSDMDLGAISPTAIAAAAASQHMDVVDYEASFFTPSSATANVKEHNDVQLLIKRGSAAGSNGYGRTIEIFTQYPYPTVFTDWAFVAELFYFGAKTDVPIGIPDRITCIYLKGADQTYAVMMTARKAGGCASSIPAASGSTRPDLDVEPSMTTMPGLPAMARFDWDGADKSSFHIGVTCGDRWCDVAIRGTARSTPHPRFARGAIKGFYDEQFLGVAPTGGVAVPGAALGTIIPEANLDDTTHTRFECTGACNANDGWVTVARVLMTDDSYLDKFNFSRTAPNESNYNSVQLRWKRTGDHWQARVLAADGSIGTKVHAVSYMDHSREPTGLPPAAARWRPLGTDEGMWVRCASGCCEISDALDSFVSTSDLSPSRRVASGQRHTR
ncbi:MAG: hypothetical protein JWM95_1607 [Gemmatimonadetes bacterium]|nr:hypothetical protein [Gemmatimonadota bacterium]